MIGIRAAALVSFAVLLACTKPNPYYVAEPSGPGGEGEGEGGAADSGFPPRDGDVGEVPHRFDVVAPAQVREDEPFEVTVSAVRADGSPVERFEATLSFAADRGDVRPATVHAQGFPAGSLPVVITLNREGLAQVSVSALGGNVRGTSGPIRVDHGSWLRHSSGAVFDKGRSGEWDEWDVSQPAVVKLGNDAPGLPGKMLLYYRGRDTPNKWRGIGVALSDDGAAWRRAELNPVMPSEGQGEEDFIDFSEPYVMLDGDRYRMWVTGTTRMETYVAHAESNDGLTWVRREPNPVLRATEQPGWDELWVFAPSVVRTDAGYEAWYGAFASDGAFGIGRATGEDGVAFAKQDGNPVLGPTRGAWDEVTVDKPSVVKDGSVYRMWYTGDAVFHDSRTDEWAIGYATSTDGVHWEKSPDNPVFSPSRVEGLFDSVRVANPSVVPVTSKDDPGRVELLLYYDGFDGERWRIGLARRE